MARDFLAQSEKQVADMTYGAQLGAGSMPRQKTRLQRYEDEKRMFEQRIALLDEAIAALKSNPETERIINLLDAL